MVEISRSSLNYVLTIGIDSNVIEVLIAFLFDVLLIGIIEKFCQIICSSFNLFYVYDSTNHTLELTARRIAQFGDTIVGPPHITLLLTIVLTFCLLSNIFIAFSVTGRSQKVYEPTKYGTIIYIKHSPEIMRVNFDKEYKVVAQLLDDDDYIMERRPTLVSSRLGALSKVDWCQSCNYTHCRILAYAYNETLGKELANFRESDEREARCISTNYFDHDLTMAIISREGNPEGWCGFDTIQLQYERNDTLDSLGFATNITYEYCGYEILSRLYCFRRSGHATRCTAVARHKEESLNSSRRYLISIGDLENIGGSLNIHRISISTMHTFRNETWDAYARNSAFMYAIDLGPPFMLELMPFVSFEHAVTLLKKSETRAERNVSDIDLRIFLTAISFLTLVFCVAGLSALITWYLFVYSKGRQQWNSFSSVIELLQLAVHTQQRAGDDMTRESLNKSSAYDRMYYAHHESNIINESSRESSVATRTRKYELATSVHVSPDSSSLEIKNFRS